MRRTITRIEYDREASETVTVVTSDGVTIEICTRALWRSVPSDAGAKRIIEAGHWVVVVS